MSSKLTVQQDAIGWYQPHLAVNSDDLVVDPRTGEISKMPSMTKQSFKEECDINNIVKRFEATGIVDHLNEKAREGVYTDLPDSMDYQQALEIGRKAQEAFASLPATIRATFQNDPAAFLAFVENPANQDKLIEMGLATDNRPPAPPPAAPPAPAVPPEVPLK